MTFSIFPRVVFKTRSKINGEIVIREQFGDYALHIQELIQSGGIVRDIWQKALKRIFNLPALPVGGQFPIFNVLILGLGGGTVVKLINKSWPGAKITGVEIDPEIIKISKKYFGLDKVGNLKIIEDDAFDFVVKTDKKFDLIIVDMYLGSQYPARAETGKFMKDIKKILSEKGVIVFNRLIVDGKSLHKFEANLNRSFVLVDRLKTHTNLFFLVK